MGILESTDSPETTPTTTEKRTHPFVNSLKWLTGAIIPASVAVLEASQYYPSGSSSTISASFPILLADGFLYLGLVASTPQDMGKGTGEYLNNKFIKPALALYQRPARTSL